MKCTPAGICGPTSRSTAVFTEPTSLTIAPGLRAGAISLASSPNDAHRSRQHDQIGVAYAFGDVVMHRVGKTHRARSLAGFLTMGIARDVAGDLPAPNRHAPSTTRSGRHRSARLFRRPVSRRRSFRAPLKFRQRRDHPAVGVFGADGETQAMWQAVIGDGTQNQPARTEKSVSFRAGFDIGEMDQNEVSDAVVHAQSQARGCSRSTMCARSRCA